MINNKIWDYTCIITAVIGTLCMINAVGLIEVDRWLHGFGSAMLGVTCFILSLYAQVASKDLVKKKK